MSRLCDCGKSSRSTAIITKKAKESSIPRQSEYFRWRRHLQYYSRLIQATAKKKLEKAKKEFLCDSEPTSSIRSEHNDGSKQSFARSKWLFIRGTEDNPKANELHVIAAELCHQDGTWRRIDSLMTNCCKLKGSTIFPTVTQFWILYTLCKDVWWWSCSIIDLYKENPASIVWHWYSRVELVIVWAWYNVSLQFDGASSKGILGGTR
jgi:hypothetical protein